MALTFEFVVKVTVFSPNCLNMTPCDVCGFAHMGPCGAKIASPYGPSVGCIQAFPYGDAHIGPIRSRP